MHCIRLVIQQVIILSPRINCGFVVTLHHPVGLSGVRVIWYFETRTSVTEKKEQVQYPQAVNLAVARVTTTFQFGVSAWISTSDDP